MELLEYLEQNAQKKGFTHTSENFKYHQKLKNEESVDPHEILLENISLNLDKFDINEVHTSIFREVTLRVFEGMEKGVFKGEFENEPFYSYKAYGCLDMAVINDSNFYLIEGKVRRSTSRDSYGRILSKATCQLRQAGRFFSKYFGIGSRRFFVYSILREKEFYFTEV